MIFFLFIFNFIFFSKPIEAKSFSYQFNLSNNLINLDFFRIINLSSPTQTINLLPAVLQVISPTVLPSLPNKILSFNYKIKKTKNLPSDLPLFIVTFGQKVIFAADANLADGLSHHVEFDLELFDSNYIGKMPIFYQNNYINDFDFSLDNLLFLPEFSNHDNDDLQLENLSAIRESDQSLTIIFSTNQQSKTPYSYELFCVDKNEQILHSIKLIKNDDFLWPSFSFFNFFSNQKKELIFHLNEFICDGSIYVLSGIGAESEQVSIINVKDL